MRWSLVLTLLLAGCLTSSPGATEVPDVATPEPGPLRGVALERVMGGFSSPVLVTHDGNATYVVEQCGTVKRLVGNASSPWLDIKARVSCGGERGLLGLAFPSDYVSKGRYYVSYTNSAGNSVLSRFVGDQEEIILTVTQPASNHNGGHLAFGPDGMLYYGLGDGGLARDAFRQAQNPATLLGSILRLDVSAATGYTVPADNPFVADPTGADEVWSYGLRNPWRFSFDSATGDLWIADVGQDAWEEVDFQPAASKGGTNYGWPVWEGTHEHEPGLALDHEFPVAEYANAGGDCSITGGHVYHGPLADLEGKYILGDYCSGIIRAVFKDNGTWAIHDILQSGLRISSFGTDAAGHLYVVDHQGAIHRFTAAP